MGIGKKLVVLIGISTIFVFEGVFLLFGFLTQSIWTCLIASAVLAFTLYYFYIRLYRKKEARYPVVPPEGKTDIYFPRTDIPRPVHADFRKIKEKKEMLEKIKKKTRHRKK